MTTSWLHLTSCPLIRKLAFGLVLTGCHPLLAAEPRLSVSLHGQGATVVEDGSPVLSYQAEPRSLDGKWSRAHYVHPLHGLDGEPITEDFPDDHRHHRGIFWAWHQVWVGDVKLGDAWACKDFQWDVRGVESSPPGNPVSITAVAHWKSSQWVDAERQPIPVVQDTVRIVVHAANDDYRVVDFDISLLALVEGVRIGGSEDEKGYGGFSPRIRMSGQERFVSGSETVQPAITAITAGTWINILGPDFGTAILVHRDNPLVQEGRAPWILRERRSMQNAVFPGREPVPLSTSEPIRLRYRLVIHDGNLAKDSIDALQREFWEAGR